MTGGAVRGDGRLAGDQRVLGVELDDGAEVEDGSSRLLMVRALWIHGKLLEDLQGCSLSFELAITLLGLLLLLLRLPMLRMRLSLVEFEVERAFPRALHRLALIFQLEGFTTRRHTSNYRLRIAAGRLVRLRVEGLELLESLVDRFLRATGETKELMLLVLIIILDRVLLYLVRQLFPLLLASRIRLRFRLLLEGPDSPLILYRVKLDVVSIERCLPLFSLVHGLSIVLLAD